MKAKNLTYKEAGVNYEEMDPFKVAATKAAMTTSRNSIQFNIWEMGESRGESAYVMRLPSGPASFLAHVEEGLGTKNKVAEAMENLGLGTRYYSNIAQCCVAMIVNDLITVGALPLSVEMHLAVGSSAWFKKRARYEALIQGWTNACNTADAVWGGGETPTLKGIVAPDTFVLSGSATGMIRSTNEYLNGRKIEHGDRIVLIQSSGIHANGLTLARDIADKLPQGYLTELPSGRTYGDVLLDPTIIYVPLIRICQEARVNIHYAVNITGHGWRKLMRAQQKFAYVIEHMPTPREIFFFLKERGPISTREAYSNLNMGAGFALYVPIRDVKSVIKIAADLGLFAIDAGEIHHAKRRSVHIKPMGIRFSEDELKVR